MVRIFYYSFCASILFHSISLCIGGRHYSKELLQLLLKAKQDIYYRNEVDHENNPTVDADVPEVGEIFEGDIVMDRDLRDAVLGQGKRSAIAQSELNENKHWPNGVVPYLLDDSLKPKVKKQILKAIEEMKLCTCVRFVEKTKDHKNYVVFKDGKGCSSSVGMSGGMQEIRLAYGCKRIGTVLHEMMHALGIIHEQSRDDRDKYIEIRYENIKKDLLHNFKKYSYLDTDNLDTPYDYNSVMHYSNYAFSKNREKKTLISKVDPKLKFGQRTQLTSLDLAQINRLYPCNKKVCSRENDPAIDLYQDMTPQDALQRKRDYEEEEMLKKLFLK